MRNEKFGVFTDGKQVVYVRSLRECSLRDGYNYFSNQKDAHDAFYKAALALPGSNGQYSMHAVEDVIEVIYSTDPDYMASLDESYMRDLDGLRQAEDYGVSERHAYVSMKLNAVFGSAD